MMAKTRKPAFTEKAGLSLRQKPSASTRRFDLRPGFAGDSPRCCKAQGCRIFWMGMTAATNLELSVPRPAEMFVIL